VYLERQDLPDVGTIAGFAVQCNTLEKQVLYHTGYKLPNNWVIWSCYMRSSGSSTLMSIPTIAKVSTLEIALNVANGGKLIDFCHELFNGHLNIDFYPYRAK